jgi:RHS repeat-associated protein
VATINGFKVATNGSNHVAPGPTPAVSLVPPPPPVGPVPAPFAYIARSETARNTSPKLEIDGWAVLVVGSDMDIEKPGNVPSQSTGGDILTHVVNAEAVVINGEPELQVEGHDVAVTGSQVRMNVPYRGMLVAQTIGTLMSVDRVLAAPSPDVVAATDQVILDPISVASGAVRDDNVDVFLPGIFDLELVRRYSSARSREHTPFGRGGFSHSLHQWIEIDGGRFILRDGDGKTVRFPEATNGRAFCRRFRLELSSEKTGAVEIFSLDTRLVRRFEPMGARAYLTAIRDRSGNLLRLFYERERLARIVDTAGRVVIVDSDADGHVVRLAVHGALDDHRANREPLWCFRYEYDREGQLAAAIDPAGNTERYRYDARRRLIQKTLPTGLSFHYQYDDAGRCVRAWGDGEIHTGTLAYDLERGITRVTGTLEPRVWHWRPSDGAIVREATADGKQCIERVYDDDGFVVEVKNGAGEVGRYHHDARGNLVAAIDAAGNQIRFEHSGDLLTRRSDERGACDFGYDGHGRIISVRYPSGASVSFDYDERGRLAAAHGPDGCMGRYRYDDHHNLIEAHGPHGEIYRWSYDPLGRCTGWIDPMGGEYRCDFDAMGRTIAVRAPDGSVERVAYDELGRVTERNDAMGLRWSFRYAGVRAPTRVLAPDGSELRLEHDRLERLQAVVNGKGERWDFRYDRSGNVSETRAFDGRITRYRRSRAGRLDRVEQPDGSWRAFRDRPDGTLAEEATPHGSITFETTREAITATVKEGDDTIGVICELDERGRVVRERQGAHAIDFEYDARDRLVARRLPGGATTRFFYDEGDKPAAVEHEGYRVELVRDRNGRVVERRFEGFRCQRAFDAMGRLTHERWLAGDRAQRELGYRYDPCGRLVERRDERAATEYEHDAFGRLLACVYDDKQERYRYDPAGNLSPREHTWETAAGGALVRTHDAEYQHDAAGCRVLERRDGRDTEYEWDCRGQLRTVICADGRIVRMSYDAFGRRVKKEVAPAMPRPDREQEHEAAVQSLGELPQSRVVEYLWDGDFLLAEIDSERGTRAFVERPGAFTPMLQREGDAIYGVVADHLGRAVGLVGSGGDVAGTSQQTAWGLELARTGVATPHRLLGHHWDEDIELCYVRHRYFDPRTARFLSPDPLELLGGMNLYAFNGSPVSHVDPFGLACMIIGDPRRDPACNIEEGALRGRYDDYYKVVVHGSLQQMGYRDAMGKGQLMSPEQLATRMRQAGNYREGSDVFLASCSTGRVKNGAAAKLSKNLRGAEVLAPNDTIWVPSTAAAMKNHGYTIAPSKLERGQSVPDMSKEGRLNRFADGNLIEGEVFG